MSQSVEILLVEDNHSDAELTMRAFKKNNLSNSIVWVKDGEEALDFLFCRGPYSDREIHETPKVILLDLKMPKIDGLEVLKEVKASDKLKTIPIVVLTSSNQESDLVKSYQLGVNSYIVKPVEFDKFTDAIREIGYYWLLINEKPPEG